MPDIVDQILEVQELLRQRGEHKSLIAPSDEPLSWRSEDQRLIRLDVAIMAMHLVSARLAFRSLPAMIRQRVQKFERGLAEWAGKWLAVKALGQAVSLPLKVAKIVYDLVRAEELEREVEQAIRRVSLRCQRELHTEILRQYRNRPRKTKLVATRHESPPQRRQNKRWKGPK